MSGQNGLAARRLVLAAGGTGGHMFPAEALGHEMRQRGWDVLLVTDHRGRRFGAGFPADEIIELPARNPNQGGVPGRLRAVRGLVGGMLIAWRRLRRQRPSIIVGFGGYPSVPAMLAAGILNLPAGVHEQNAVLGRANRLSARRALFIAHGFETLRGTPKNLRAELVHTGNPVRPPIAAAGPAAYVAPAEGRDPVHLLVTGGSQGARLFGEVVPAALGLLAPALRGRLSVVHQVTVNEQPGAAEAYAQAGIKVTMAAFFDDMAVQLARAHLVIARAGASSVTELAVIGRPAILVPLAIAMDDHQAENAAVLTEAGAAAMLRESELTPERLGVLLDTLLGDPGRLAAMADNAAQAVPRDAVKKLADTIEASVIKRVHKKCDRFLGSNAR